MHSLNKGRAAERAVVNSLQPIINHVYEIAGRRPPKLERRPLGTSGQDIMGLEWLSLEVKHRRQSAIPSWWRQCCEQAANASINQTATPALFYRGNHKPWRVRMHTKDYMVFIDCNTLEPVVDITERDFQFYLYRRLCHQLGQAPRG